MRESFSGFYGVSEDTIGKVFTSDNTVFIYDANILLSLYRCEEETRNQFISIWRKIKDQCWFPHQVCLEYQRNRLQVIKDSRDSLTNISSEINNSIQSLKKKIFGEDHNKTISRYTNLGDELKNLFIRIEEYSSDFRKSSIIERNQNINFLSGHDAIRDLIDELTVDKIGPAPTSQKIIDDLNKEGKIRYKYKTGPGFADQTEKRNFFYSFDGLNYDAEFGDLYVWSEILKFVEIHHDKNIVYITNDAKSDFFYRIDGKVRGPNESLTTEIKRKGAKEFILQNLSTFLHHANTHLHAKVAEDAITELSNAGKQVITAKRKDLFHHFKEFTIARELSHLSLNELFDLSLVLDADMFELEDELSRHEIGFYEKQSVEQLNETAMTRKMIEAELAAVSMRSNVVTRLIEHKKNEKAGAANDVMYSTPSDK